jgi:signal transduction histidine kinase/DNA-binding NarL/FixJ family response regulator
MRPIGALVDLVSRAPARVQVKLLAAFLAIVVLLITVGAVGLQVLSRVNHRTEELIKLQRQIDAYRQVQHDTTSQLYSVSSALLSSEDLTLSSTLRQLGLFGYNVDRLQFVAKDEVQLLDLFRHDYDQFTTVVMDVVELIRAGRVAEARELQLAQIAPLADRLERITNQLVNRAEANMVAGIEASDQAYATSQWIVVAFALGSIVLALILGYVMSLSLIGPVTEVEARLKQIAAGDFSQRVRVINRDELGALAANVNRTSEQLGCLYQQLELANLAKSRFLAAASHDLRQPLHALNLFLDQLRHERNQAERNQLLARIDTAVASMNELFNALLDISRLDAGVLAPSISDFPLDGLLKRIETTFMTAARDKGLRLRIVSSRAWVRSDFILLERILLNLVSNAVRYTERGGIVVGCRLRDDRLRIDVCDSGIGIPEDQRRNIFGEFYQLGGGNSGGSSGLGLGLAIVDRLCGLLDHPIELNSRVGSGSRFSLSIPSAPARAAAAAAPDMPQALLASEPGKLVIVIDDNESVRDSTRGVLQRWGCVVVTADSEDAALVRLAELGKRPDLIISDYRLAHGKTGFELIDRMRRACGAQIPAFLISGDTTPERLREAHDSGYYLLLKPVMPITLRSVVTQLLRGQDNAPTGPGSIVVRPPTIQPAAADPSPAHPPQ